MQVKLQLDKTNRVEVYFDGPNMKVRGLTDLDTLVSSCRCPSLVVSTDFLSDMNMIKSQRNSQYKLIASIDPDGGTFGGNKVYQIHDLIEADGFDIGLTANKNKTELINEIKGISAFLQSAGKDFVIRWSINAKHGPDHIKTCMEAIKGSGIKYDLISILCHGESSKTAHNIVKKCRKQIGMMKCKMKITGIPDDDLFKNDANLLYQVRAEDLM